MPTLSARLAPQMTEMNEAFTQLLAREWWGNTVGTASFHDGWLADGFADFSGSLSDDPAAFRDHWAKAREALLRAPRSFDSELRPNDAGPLWMGELTNTAKTTGNPKRMDIHFVPRPAGAAGVLSTSKGGFVLQMLRCMMWDAKSGDRDFRGLMQDYVRQFANQAASTEDFKAVVDQHMKPSMDLEGNHRMDWFFNDWVYGTDIPSYHLEYSLGRDANGKTLLTGKLTQSGVSAGFAMPVPIFGEFGAKTVRVGVIPIRGDSTGEFQVRLPEMPKRILLNFDQDVLTEKEEVKRFGK
jgi:aminopeptidase N